MENKRFYYKFEVLTPLAVGAGTEKDLLPGVDYIQRGKKVYVIDMNRLFELGINVDDIADAFLQGTEGSISQLVANKLDNVSKRVFDAPVSRATSIKSQIRTQFIDKPLVPGSSIKGAINSALFKYFHSDETVSAMVDERVFGSKDDGSVFTRFFHVGDVIMPTTTLVNTKIFNLRKEGNSWHGGWKYSLRVRGSQKSNGPHYDPEQFNTIYECVTPSTTGYGAIDVAYSAFQRAFKEADIEKHAYFQEKKALLKDGITGLFHAINEATKHYLEKEKDFFEHYNDGDRVKEIIESISSLLNLFPEDDSYCIMKMAAGVGFHSITGDWLAPNNYYEEPGFRYDEKTGNFIKRYKSRKIAEYDGHLQMMGFVVLRAIEENGEASYHDHLERMKVSDAQLRAEAEAAERQAAAEREEAMRKQAAARRDLEDKYDGYMDEAKALAEAKKWDEAVAKAQEAAKLIPERDEHATWINSWTNQKAIEAANQAAKDAAGERYKQPLADVLKTTSLGNVIGTTKKWVENNGGISAFGENELKALFAAIQSLPPKGKKQLDRKRKDFVKAVGEQWTASLYELFS